MSASPIESACKRSQMGSECITKGNQCSEPKPISRRGGGNFVKGYKKEDDFVKGRNGG